jgi:hypothetical protein
VIKWLRFKWKVQPVGGYMGGTKWNDSRMKKKWLKTENIYLLALLFSFIKCCAVDYCIILFKFFPFIWLKIKKNMRIRACRFFNQRILITLSGIS